MKSIFILFGIPVFLSLNSCCGCYDDSAENIDSTVLVFTNPIDTAKNIDTVAYLDEERDLHLDIEKQYGVQWDFCDCVVKNDSIEKAILATDDDAQIDQILVRMDEVDLHCKAMLAQPNTTPEQRDRHARKVRKCLKEAGVK